MKKLYEIMLINFRKEELKQKALFALKGIEKIRIISICLVLLMSLAFQNVSAQDEYIPVTNMYTEFSHDAIDDEGNVYMSMVVGDNGLIYVYINPWDATIQEITVEVDPPDIINISVDWSEIIVFAYSEGETVITIRSLDPSYTEALTIGVKVRSIEQGEMAINPEVLTLETTDSGFMQAVLVVDPDNTVVIYNVTWSISDDMVASIEEGSGSIYAITPGEAIITATFAENITATSHLTVVRKPPAMPSTPMISRISNEVFYNHSYEGPGNGIGVMVEIGAKIKIVSNGEAYGLRYTLDGSDPLGVSFTQVSASSGSQVITINEGMIVRAVAFNQDPYFTVYSREMAYQFFPQLKMPFAIVPTTTNYLEYGQMVELKEANLVTGAQIRYTTDGTTPNSSSKLYTGPIKVDETIIRYITYGYSQLEGYGLLIQARVYCEGYEGSRVYEKRNLVRVNAPVINPLTGVITCATPFAKIYYTLGDPPYGTDPNESSQLYTEPVSNAGFTTYKILRAVAYKNNLEKSLTTHCYFYANAPEPVVKMWSYQQNKYIESPKKDFIVANEDRFMMDTPGYPAATIRYTVDGKPVTPTHGMEWDKTYDYGIYHNTVINAKSYLPPRPESNNVIFKFDIMEKPAKPTTNVPYIVVDPGTPVCFYSSTLYAGLVFTTDGTTPYVEPIGGDSYGLIYNINGYVCYPNGPLACSYYKYGAGGGLWPLTIDKTCTYRVIAYKRTPDGGVVMSDVESFTYRVASQNVTMDIEKGDLSKIIPGIGKETMGLAGKLLKLFLKDIDSVSDEIGGVSYLAVCKSLKNAQSDAAKVLAFQKINNSFSADYKNVTVENIKSVIEPYKFSQGGGGFGFELETGGILLGSGTSMNGGLYLKGKASAEGKAKFPLLPPVLNLTCKIGISAEVTALQKLTILTKNPYTTRSQSELKYEIDVKTSAALGIPFVASVSFHGDAKFHHSWTVNSSTHNMWLQGKFYATATMVGYTTDEFYFVKVRKDIISGKSDFSDFRFPDFTSDSGYYGWKLIPRNYLKNQSVWLGTTPPDRSASIFSVLQESIYSETDPKIAEGGGKRVMVFLADDPARDDFNRSILMYSIYNSSNDTWSEPLAVNNNGRADYYPSISSNGSSIWIAWQNSNKVFDDNSTIEDVYSAGEIAVASFNSATSTFNTPTMLTANTFMDASPVITVLPSGNVSVTWIQNQESDIYGSNNSNKIMEASYNGTTWLGVNEVSGGLAPIYDLDINWFNNDVQIAYLTDGDNRDEDEYNLIITNLTGSESQTIVSNQALSGIHFTALGGTKVLTWLENDHLRYMSEGGFIQNLTDSADMQIMKYKIFTNGDKTAIVYPELEKGRGVLTARHYEDGKFGNPYKLVTTGGVAHKYDGLLESNNDFYIVYNNSVRGDDDDDIEENDLITLKCPAPVNLRLLDVFFFQEDVKLGQQLPVRVLVENIGGMPINEVAVKIDGTLLNLFTAELNIGEKDTIRFEMNVPSSMEPLTNFVVSVEPYGMTDVDLDDNFLTVTLGYVNFSMMLTTQFNDGNTVTVTAEITNDSDYDADTKMIARIGAEDGEVIDFFDFGNIEGRENIVKTFNYDLEDLCPEGQEIPLYYELVFNRDAEFRSSSFVILHNLSGSIMADSLIVGIEPIEMKPVNNNSVSIYPNPTTGQLIIENGELIMEKIDIFDVMGRNLGTLPFSPSITGGWGEVDISHLPSGFYFLRIQTDKGVITAKVVKN